MSIFANMSSTGLEESQDSLGGFSLLESDIYEATIKALSEQVDHVVDYLSNSRDQMVLNKAMDYPVIRQLLTYCPVGNKTVGTVFAALFPIGLPVWLIGLRHQKNLKRDVNLTIKTCDQLVAIINGEYNREMEYN